MPEDSQRTTEAVAEQELSRDRRNDDPNHIAAQLHTMVGAVRALNESAAEQGAAVALSAAGMQLKNAVIGLGHLLAAVDGDAMASGAAAPVREAAQVAEAVEAGLASTRSAVAQTQRPLSAEQADRIRGFDREMRQALAQVRSALEGLNIR